MANLFAARMGTRKGRGGVNEAAGAKEVCGVKEAGGTKEAGGLGRFCCAELGFALKSKHGDFYYRMGRLDFKRRRVGRRLKAL